MIYNLEYYEHMLRIYSKTAEQICKIRWNFIKEIKLLTILDYGSGVGWFRAYRPKDIEVDSYDIANYPQTGIQKKEYDLVCFWDVLEHLENFNQIKSLLINTKAVAVSMPIKPKKIKLENWKHFKPNEHLHYFTIETLDALFKTYNFIKLKGGYPECPPRTDVYSALYKKG